MATPVTLYSLATSEVAVGGTAVVAAYGTLLGGYIVNPQSSYDQGIARVEVLYVDVVGTAGTSETATTVAIQPGQYFTIPNQTTNVSVNAATSGHKFSGFVIQPQAPYPPTPQTGVFPPSGPTTLTVTIPSYLYEQYANDDNLQAFVMAYNQLTQIYVTWLATVPLPVYTNAAITGALLDWVAFGLYGLQRPSLSYGSIRHVGPLNTYCFNSLPYNQRKRTGNSGVTVVSDDVFKRIITWNFYKGDGTAFNVRWLKRRAARFLLGVNGTDPGVNQTYQIGVTFPSAGNVTINLGSSYGLESVLQQAIESGVVQLPFQYAFTCTL